MSSARFKKIIPERRVEHVRNQLHAAIYSGTLKPGEVLREVELCKSFGVSQAPVREALAELENIALVVRTPNRRTEVKNLTYEELGERIEVRVSLETLACYRAVHNNWRKADFAALEQRAEAILTPDPLADLAFHRYVWDRAGNAVLLQSLLQISSCLFGFASILRAAGLQDKNSRRQSHQNFIEALRTRDRNVIGREVQAHLDTAYAGFRDRKPRVDFKTLADELVRPSLPEIEASELVLLSSI